MSTMKSNSMKEFQDSGSDTGQFHPNKRKRQTISCLNCKKRKVRCDKTKPCNHCRHRDEVDLCEYQEGHTPPPPQSFVSSSEFTALQTQVSRLEDRLAQALGSLKNTPLPTTPSINTPTSLCSAQSRKAEVLEKALVSMDVLCDDTDNSNCRARTGLILSMRQVAARPSRPSNWPSIKSTMSIDERPMRWRIEMLANVAALPEQPVLDSLVQHFFDKIDSFWHLLHRRVFLEELAMFHELRSSNNVLLVDPAWLAILIAMICTAVQSLFGGDFTTAAFDPGIDTSGFDAMGKELDQSLDSALLCAGALHSPQFRIIQALIIMLGRMQVDEAYHMFEGKSAIPIETQWLDLAISNCKGLRLHILGPDFEKDPPPDLAFPPGNSLYAREMTSRVVHQLAFWDQITGCIGSDSSGSWVDPSPFRFPRGSITTPLPRNVLDSDLYPTGPMIVQPQPMFVKTEITWILHMVNIGSLWSTITELLSDISSLTVDMVGEVDKELRRGMDELIAMKMSSHLVDAEEMASESLLGSYNQRLIRIHRHFFLRSYSEPAYHYSQAAALTAARQVIRGHHNISVRFPGQIPFQQSLVFYAHHVSANVILFVHGCLSPASRDQMRAEIATSADLFEKSNFKGHTHWAQAVLHGSRLVKMLLKALNDPPKTIEKIETFLLDLRMQANRELHISHEAVSATVDPTTVAYDALPFMNELGWTNVASAEMPLVDFDWDSLFRGF